MKRLSGDGYIRALEGKRRDVSSVIAIWFALPWAVLALFIAVAFASLLSCEVNPEKWRTVDVTFVRLESREPVEFMQHKKRTYLVAEEGEYYAYRIWDELWASGLEDVVPGTQLQLVLYDAGLSLYEKERLAAVYSADKVYCSADHILWWQWFDFWCALASLIVMIAVCVAVNVWQVKHTLRDLLKRKRDVERKIAIRNEKMNRKRVAMNR